MAAGAAPAPQKKAETKAESTESPESPALTLKQRIAHRLHEIFAGREEYLGWRQ